MPAFEGGAEVVLDEDVLLGSKHEHAGRVLFVEGLVLDGEGVDGDAIGLHALDVLDEVGGVGGEVFGQKDAALCAAVGLHPERSGPGRGEGFDFGIDGEDLLHDGDDGVFVGVEGEVGHGDVGVAGGEVVVGVDAGVHVGRADGEAEVADADAVAGAGEEFMQEGVALGGVHVHEELGAAAGEREAEAVDGLVGLGGVDVDGLGGCGGSGGEGDGRLELEEGGAVGGGEVEGDVLLGGGLGRCGEGCG